MTFNLDALQRAAFSLVGALFLATVFVGSAVVPSETVVAVAPVA
ncbi:hypothetical protein [Sphingobium boeckii]|uniref:Uncharacterized protein n=1 Tax=Sphingobium boeckii TaxID=1082345 RepID=A0A7W9AER6_9SPHN|nr:hypothetical protein [Sphingobium boeckii]MBB5684238.1 hypothetical protein [Sphingobium boeckii]